MHSKKAKMCSVVTFTIRNKSERVCGNCPGQHSAKNYLSISEHQNLMVGVEIHPANAVNAELGMERYRCGISALNVQLRSRKCITKGLYCDWHHCRLL